MRSRGWSTVIQYAHKVRMSAESAVQNVVPSVGQDWIVCDSHDDRHGWVFQQGDAAHIPVPIAVVSVVHGVQKKRKNEKDQQGFTPADYGHLAEGQGKTCVRKRESGDGQGDRVFLQHTRMIGGDR